MILLCLGTQCVLWWPLCVQVRARVPGGCVCRWCQPCRHDGALPGIAGVRSPGLIVVGFFRLTRRVYSDRPKR